MSRVVVLIELTCPAEEGMGAAQLRKETKYSALLDSINATNVWKASLWTLEIGARGLVGLSSHKRISSFARMSRVVLLMELTRPSFVPQKKKLGAESAGKK